jgi:hypothetical protein
MVDMIFSKILLGLLGTIIIGVILVSRMFHEQMGGYPEPQKNQKELIYSTVLFLIFFGGLFAWMAYNIMR